MSYMSYDEFVHSFTNELQENMEDDGVELERNEVNKVNENAKEGLIIKFPGSNISTNIYPEDKYKDYLSGDSVEEIAERTAFQIRHAMEDAPPVPELSKESAQENLYGVIINAESNEMLLKDVPHESFQDLAVIPRFRVADNASFIVRNTHCEAFQMTSEEILERALSNTKEQDFSCKSMTEVLTDMMKDQGMPDDYIDEFMSMQGEDCPMYVVTNSSKVDGAVAMICPNVMEQSYEHIKQDHPDMDKMYILGSSRHELILVPDDAIDNVEDLKMIHQQVQATELDPVDKLSESIYSYDGRTMQVSIENSPAESESEEEALEEAESVGRSM